MGRRCAVAQQRCELKLLQLARQDEELQQAEQTLVMRMQGMKQLLESQRPTDVVVDRGGLFEVLRKQAVLRSQLQNLGLEAGQLEEQRRELAERRTVQRNEHRHWLRKQDKYQRWTSLMRKQERLLRLRQEESEQEERCKWTR